MEYQEIINWLLEGDVSIRYQVFRDLLGETREDLRKRIAVEGWGAGLLAHRRENGHWGRGFYQPKWISSHYTILDLKNLGINPDNSQVRETIEMILKDEKGRDGGINPSRTIPQSDICVTGMFLNYASYFGVEQEKLVSVVDFILSQRMNDGGFNCDFNQKGAKHSSLHSTLSVIEGIEEYSAGGYTYGISELNEARESSRLFILLHKFFLSDKTGEIINRNFLRFTYPSRWKYDILRSLDYFRLSGRGFDERMLPAINLLIDKRRKDNRWPLHGRYPGQTHFDMEKPGEPSRWNTLRALRVLKYFGFKPIEILTVK